MKLSVVTPTHKGDYLQELYDSLKDQTYNNWEWLLYLNGGLRRDDLPIEIVNDPKVVIHHDIKTTFSANVGYLKNKAFHIATGDILVEVDHDDVITPDCLAEVAKAFEDPKIGFVYSDNAKLQDDFIPYGAEFGWSYRDVEWKGKRYISMDSFEPSANCVSLIWFAPDHVRAWRASVYKEVGGHNPELSILDDQELMMRTYMVTLFKYIPKTLYFYRIHGDNTWLERNQAIQEGTVQMMLEWQQRLAERDADLRGLRKIDIGGGLYPKEGYESVDIKNGMITADLTKRWPFEDGEVGVINASHIIEHLPDKHHTMSEMHRVLADMGWAFIEVPSTDGRGAFQDPTHVSYWNQNSFWYYTRRDQAQFIYNENIKFQAFQLDTYFPNEWMYENNIPITRAYLTAIKSDKRRPNIIDI
jgi:glycosyltransferase involved in cell wall biosynthesis